MARLDIHSPYTPEECVSRLRAGLSNPSSEVDGRVEHDRIRLRKRLFFHNSFQTFLHAELQPVATGTRVRCRLEMHPIVVGVMAFWFAGVVIANLFLLTLTVREGKLPGGWFIPPLLLTFGTVMVWVGRRLSRGQGEFLTRFVVSLVDGKVTEQGV